MVIPIDVLPLFVPGYSEPPYSEISVCTRATDHTRYPALIQYEVRKVRKQRKRNQPRERIVTDFQWDYKPLKSALGDRWWPLAMARELDDAILLLRTNELDLGLVLIKTTGSAAAVLASDAMMLKHREDWLVRETMGMLRRTFRDWK